MKKTTMIKDLYLLYKQTLEHDFDSDSFRAIPLEGGTPHRIGCSDKNNPMLFVECCNKEHITDIKLSLFRVLFNRKCFIVDVEKGLREEKTFSIIEMNSTDEDLIKYFFQVMAIVLQKLPTKPGVNELKLELSKVIKIFKLQQNFSKDVVRGLWAELLIIERSTDPNYLLRAWHEGPEDKYDFNDSIDKIEVKSTNGDYRSHIFSMEQLTPNPESNLLIASVFVNPAGEGKSVFDLIDLIDERIIDVELSLKMRELALATIGPHIEECSKLKFDYGFGVDSIRFFDYKLIPSINTCNIPVEVSGVSFRSDISGVMSIDEYDYEKQGKLFGCI